MRAALRRVSIRYSFKILQHVLTVESLKDTEVDINIVPSLSQVY